MALVFREAHAAPDKKKLNEEWFVLENTGGVAINTARPAGARRQRKGKRGSLLGMIDPGFMLQPGEKIVVVAARPARSRTASRPRREKMRVYHLLQREGLLQGDRHDHPPGAEPDGDRAPRVRRGEARRHRRGRRAARRPSPSPRRGGPRERG